MFEDIKKQARSAMEQLLLQARPEQGELVVVGCSSSEVVGERIGTFSSAEAAEAVLEGIALPLREKGLFLAAQCCEHLNRAVIVERAAAKAHGLEIVNVVPHAHAGGAFAAAVYARLDSPVAVECVRASAGMDIGGVLIGMQLKPVAVPVRISIDKIGSARLTLARTRPKYIGGERAKYNQDCM